MRRFRLVPLLSLAVIGCKTGGPDDDFPFDRGCITIDGQDGYLWLSDAISQASEGSEIRLCNGRFTETVTIDKQVTLIGNGMGRTVLEGPINQPTLILTEGADVRLEGMTIWSTRTAVEATNARLEVDSVFFDGVGNFAIDATDSQVVATGIEIERAGWGGVQVSGGSLDLSDSTIDMSTAFGVAALRNAVATVARTSITNTRFSGDGSEGVDDGYAVWVASGAKAELSGNTLSGNTLGAVLVEAATLSMSGDVLDNNYVGMWVDAALDLQVTDVTISNSYQYGVVALFSHQAVFDGVDILTDPELSALHDDEQELIGSYGIIGIDCDLTFKNGTISGNNTAGAWFEISRSTAVSAVLENVSLDNNARIGLAMIYGTLDATDTTISRTRDNPSCMDEFGSAQCNFGLLTVEVETNWSGGGLIDNESFGAVLFSSALTTDGITVAGNELFGIYADDSALTVTNGVFDAPGLVGVGLFGSTYGTFLNTAFKNNSAPQIYDWGTGDTSHYHYSATDIAASSGATLTVRGSTFESGDQGIDGFDATIDVRDSTFTGYNSRAFDTYLGSAKLVGVDISQTGAYAVNCNNGAINLEDSSLVDIVPVKSWWQDFDALGVVVSESKSTYDGPAIYAWGCAVDFDDVLIDQVRERAIYAVNGSLDADGLTVRGAGAVSGPGVGAVHVSVMSPSAADVWFNDLVIKGVSGDGLRLTGASSDDDTVELERITLGAADAPIAGAGLVLSDVKGVTIEGMAVSSTGASGLSFTRAEVVVDGTANGGSGLITSAGADGIAVTRGAVRLENLSVTGAAGAGISLVGGANALDTVAVSGAGTWGMQCAVDDDAPAFDGCIAVTLDGTLGAHDQCGACVE